MKICILTFDYPPRPVYGSGVYVDHLTKLLRAADHVVEIITVNRFGLICEEDAIFCDCTCSHKALEKGKCVCSFGHMGCFPGLLEKALKRFEKDDFSPDVIYVNGYMFFDLALALKARYMSAKLISAIHFMVEQNEVNEDDPERISIYNEESRMISSSDEIIYFGELAYKLIQRRSICDMGKLHLIPHSYNVEICRRKFNGNHRFAYVGRIEHGKGIEHLCEAFARLDQTFTFDIIGTGRLYSSIKEKYGHIFNVYGYKNKSFVLEKLKSADFFLLPSFSEQCPVVVLEGMACGCIPILSNFGSLPDMLEETSSGILIDIEREYELFVGNIADAIKMALQISDTQANEMILTNYYLLQRYFSPKKMLDQTLAVFKL